MFCAEQSLEHSTIIIWKVTLINAKLCNKESTKRSITWNYIYYDISSTLKWKLTVVFPHHRVWWNRTIVCFVSCGCLNLVDRSLWKSVSPTVSRFPTLIGRAVQCVAFELWRNETTVKPAAVQKNTVKPAAIDFIQRF